MSLIDYAKTARQREAIKAWEECGEVAVNAAAIDAATTQDELNAIDINAGWPE